MKNLFRLSLGVMLCFIIQSCEDNEFPTLEAVNGDTLISFQTTRVNLPVIIDETGSIDVQVNSTTVSSQDRNFDVMIVSSQLSANNYEVGNVNIPANSHLGTLTVRGIDVNIETTAKTLTVEIAEGEGYTTEGQLEVSIFQVCPVPDDFLVGNYLMEQLSGMAPFASIGQAFGEQNVTISADGTVRSFDFLYSPTGFQSQYRMDLNLVCNTIMPSGRILVGSLGCSGGASSIGQSAPSTLSTYDIANGDNVITVDILDFEPNGGCTPDPYVAQIRLTKQ